MLKSRKVGKYRLGELTILCLTFSWRIMGIKNVDIQTSLSWGWK